MLSVFVNAVSEKTPVACNAPGNSEVGAQIGNNSAYGAGSRRWKGYLDEIRVSNVARPLAWLALEYNCVANQASVVTWGAEQSAVTPVFGGRILNRSGSVQRFGGRILQRL